MCLVSECELDGGALPPRVWAASGFTSRVAAGAYAPGPRLPTGAGAAEKEVDVEPADQECSAA